MGSINEEKDKSAESETNCTREDLQESLQLLIERDNPMANAAENAYELL